MKKIFKIVLGIVGIFLVLALIGGSSDTTQNSNTQADNVQTNSNVQAQEQTQEQPTQEQPTQEQTTQETSEPVLIASWEGSTKKNTETFHVPSKEWKISWDTKPGEYGDMNFIVNLYDADGNYVDLVANCIGANVANTTMRGAGDYYLDINTAQPYKIYVETQ